MSAHPNFAAFLIGTALALIPILCGIGLGVVSHRKLHVKTAQSFERAQIIIAKAGDTIAVMSDAYMSANERLLLISLFQAKLPEGVKVMVLDRGMKLVHVEATATSSARPMPHIPQPTP